MRTVSRVGRATFWLLVELLQPVLELGEVMDLALEHLHRIVLLHPFDIITAVLELAHLVHATDNLLLGHPELLVHHGLLLHDVVVLRLVHNLDSSDIRAISLVVLELDIVIQEEVHETSLLVLWELTEYECLRLRRLLHLALSEG